MPPLDFLPKHAIDEFVLFYRGQAFEVGRDDVEAVHGAATATDILDLSE